MTMEAASMQSQALSVARAEVAAELAQLRAERDWLARRIAAATFQSCPEALGDVTCEMGCSVTVFPDGRETPNSQNALSDCWLRAAAKATEPKEATE